MRILKKKITYKNKPYIAEMYRGDKGGYYKVVIKNTFFAKLAKPAYTKLKKSNIFPTDIPLMEMITTTLDEYVKEQYWFQKITNGLGIEELSEIDKIKEWDGVINEF